MHICILAKYGENIAPMNKDFSSLEPVDNKQKNGASNDSHYRRKSFHYVKLTENYFIILLHSAISDETIG